MKKTKSPYIIIISLMIGITFGWLIKNIQHKKEAEEEGKLINLNKRMNQHLQKIHLNFKKLHEENYNKSFLRAEISNELAKIDKLTPKEDTSYFTEHKNFTINNLNTFKDLTIENERLKKLLEFHENNYSPCHVKNINIGYLSKKIYETKSIQLKKLKSYKIPLINTNRTKYYLTEAPFTYLTNKDTRLLIIKDLMESSINAYFISNNKKPIKVYYSHIKGDACHKINSKLFENGLLETYEYNCKTSQKIITHHQL